MSKLTKEENLQIAESLANALAVSSHMNDDELKAIIRDVIEEEQEIPKDEKENAFNTYYEQILKIRKNQI